MKVKTACPKIRVGLFVVALLSFASVLMAIAPGIVFDLDGNSILDHGLDDWNLLNGSTPIANCSSSLGLPGSSLIRVFCSSENPPKIFTGGSTKDPLDTNSWKWKVADTVPDKDTITNGYAAEYVSAGHQIFVFGADRFAVNGDANIGIWFFQNNVGPQSDFSFGPGVHANGDIFAVSAFTNGGVNPTISVYLWDTSCAKADKVVVAGSCSAANLRLKFASATGSTCNTADEACAAVNGTGPITVSWPYAAKFGSTSNQVPPSGFFEGGIDVTELFGGTVPCFSTFLEETRSSQEPSAVLKDFVSGSFNTCGSLAITKNCLCTGLVNNTSQYRYDVSGTVSTITSAGFSNAFYNVVVSDPTAGVTCNIGTVPANTTVTWGAGGTYPCSASNHFDTNNRGPSNSAWVQGNRGGSTGSLVGADQSISATTTCDVSQCPVNPGIAVTKSCTTAVELNPFRIRVDFAGTVSNQGNLFLNNVRVCDDDNTLPPAFPFVTCDQNIVGPITLNPQGQAGDSAAFSGSYYPTSATTISPGRAEFHDSVKATADQPALSTAPAPVDIHAASCALCPPGSAACPVP